MKTTITVLLILISSVTSSLFSQVSSSKEYLKATNHLWNVYSYFDGVKDSEDRNKEKNTALPLIKKNIDNARKEYISLNTTLPNDEDVKKLGFWINAVDGVYRILNGSDWESDPSWELAIYLMKLDLQDFVNGKL